MTASESVIGVIGGSGIYDIEGLSNIRWEGVTSPFGEPSDELLFGDVEGQRMVFLPRHGRGHKLPPDGVNYRANIDALKRSGVTDILSLSAVGSLREELVKAHATEIPHPSLEQESGEVPMPCVDQRWR